MCEDDDDDKNNTVGSVAVPVRRGSKEEVKELADELEDMDAVFTDRSSRSLVVIFVAR